MGSTFITDGLNTEIRKSRPVFAIQVLWSVIVLYCQHNPKSVERENSWVLIGYPLRNYNFSELSTLNQNERRVKIRHFSSIIIQKVSGNPRTTFPAAISP